MKALFDVPSEHFMDKSTGKYYPKPRIQPPTNASIRSNLIKLAMDSYKPARKGAFQKKLSRKQRKSKRSCG